MYTISALYVYPIKSMAGIALQSAQITETGFAFDRFWMLVDEGGQFITQREFPIMALFKLQFVEEGIEVTFNGESITVCKEPQGTENIECQIWEDTLIALKEPSKISKWFSKHLGISVSLVRLADHSNRYVKRHAPAKVHFPDSSPYLVIGEASLHLLNEKLNNPVEMDRFRPNIVFHGGEPHDEDTWKRIQIGGSFFKSTKACPRCTVTTINQRTGEQGEEPLVSLSKYRHKERKILFGNYFKNGDASGESLKVGDKIIIK